MLKTLFVIVDLNEKIWFWLIFCSYPLPVIQIRGTDDWAGRFHSMFCYTVPSIKLILSVITVFVINGGFGNRKSTKYILKFCDKYDNLKTLDHQKLELSKD